MTHEEVLDRLLTENCWNPCSLYEHDDACRQYTVELCCITYTIHAVRVRWNMEGSQFQIASLVRG
jgi:hypothetical protein